MTSVDWLVIGSGPAGCAATSALIRAGIRPLVIDGGIESVPNPNHVEIGSQTEPGRKAWFGSTAAYSQPQPALVNYAESLSARVSYGRGGFSRVWGATADLPTDWDHWPAGCRPLKADAAFLDDLLPRATTAWGPDLALAGDRRVVPGSPSSRRILDAVQRVGSTRNWFVTPSTVAIETRQSSPWVCRPCAQCLDGCPRHSIWFSGDVIDGWVRADQIDYLPGHAVERMSETTSGVELCTRLPGGADKRITARHVLVGAGPISSAALALKSGLVGSPVRIADTATAYTGVLDIRAAPESGGFHHGLTQWWIRDGHHLLLAQVYPPSKQHADRLASRLPGGSRWANAAATQVTRHLHPVIAYLSQVESDTLIVAERGERITVEPDDQGAREKFTKRLRDLARVFRRAGYLMPVRAAEFTAAGTGYHMGATWPCGTASDTLGRLPGSNRIHFVDASVLPALPLGSITPSVMINAMRIAREAAGVGS